MEKTVDKTMINTLHKKNKPQKVIDKRAGSSQSAVLKNVYKKKNYLERKSVIGKGVQATGINAVL